MSASNMEDHVSWKALLFILGSLSVFFISALSATLREAKAAASAPHAEVVGRITRLEDDVEQNKKENDTGIEEARHDIRDLYKYLITKQPQPRLEKPHTEHP